MNFLQSKKGQGLSLNVIIIAALSLIVLVVLILVFTGRIAVFSEGVNQEGQADLVRLKVGYAQCQPSASDERAFLSAMEAAARDDATREQNEIQAYDTLESRISVCRQAGADRTSCQFASCRWADN